MLPVPGLCGDPRSRTEHAAVHPWEASSVTSDLEMASRVISTESPLSAGKHRCPGDHLLCQATRRLCRSAAARLCRPSPWQVCGDLRRQASLSSPTSLPRRVGVGTRLLSKQHKGLQVPNVPGSPHSAESALLGASPQVHALPAASPSSDSLWASPAPPLQAVWTFLFEPRGSHTRPPPPRAASHRYRDQGGLGRVPLLT